VSGQEGLAPGVVKVRLCGELAGIEAVAAVLGAGLGRDIEQIERSAPYPNRRDPGVRVYVTVLVDRKDEGSPQ
jgi:hypothetical protein